MATPSSTTTTIPSNSQDPESLKMKRVLSTKLYFDIPPSKVPLIYSSSYDIAFFGMEKLHPFDSKKWGRICGFLIKDGVLKSNWLIQPLEASEDDLLVGSEWKEKAETLELELQQCYKAQARLSQQLVTEVAGTRLVRVVLQDKDSEILILQKQASEQRDKCCELEIVVRDQAKSLELVLSENKVLKTKLEELSLKAKHLGDENKMLIDRWMLEKMKDAELLNEVHSESYLKSLKSSLRVSIIMEVPPVALLPNYLVQQKALYPFRKQVGGTILAAKVAKERGWAINVGGGFHHCSAETGGGFCAYADISLCIHFAFIQLNISRVMIIDLDAHQGNGHERDFMNEGRVFILDMYNPEIYPYDYEARSSIDQEVEVLSGTTTDVYLQKLDKALEEAGNKFDPELVVYNAGTDILDGDPLGQLKVSPDGVISRDEKVFKFAKDKKIPLVMLTSGGYMKSSARVIADSIVNLKKKNLIDLEISQ